MSTLTDLRVARFLARGVAARRMAIMARRSALVRGRKFRIAYPRASVFMGRRFRGFQRGFQRVAGKELKYIDQMNLATKVFDTTGTITMINGCAAGTDNTNRIGRKITLKSYEVRGTITPVDTLVTGANCVQTSHCRLMIVYDRQPTGSLPSISDILNSANSNDMVNMQNGHRFLILTNFECSVGPQVADTTATQAVMHGSTGVPVRIYRRLNLPEQFDGTGSTISDIVNGAMYCVTVGDQAAGTGATSVLSARIRFTDA